MSEKRNELVPMGRALENIQSRPHSESAMVTRSIEQALGRFERQESIAALIGHGRDDINSISSIRRVAEEFCSELDRQKREESQLHSAVMKSETVTPLEIVLKETPWKQWYTTGKALGNLASIGAKVAFQLLKNKNNEKLFRKLRVYEIDLVRLRIERDYK
jgi:hypothetical protein